MFSPQYTKDNHVYQSRPLLFISLDNSANGTGYIDICFEFVGGLGVFSSLTVSIDNKSLNVDLTLNY